MRTTRVRVCCLSAVLLAAGCWTTEPSLKPPPRPEAYATPPMEDSRFSNPIAYPKGTLNQDTIKKKDPNGPGGMPPTLTPNPAMGGI